MTLPVFHRPGTVAIVDDDADFLKMLSADLTSKWNCRFFSDGYDFLKYMRGDVALFETDLWAQQQAFVRCIAGERLVPQIIDYWEKFPDRFAVTRVCVVDRQMPLDGFEVLERLGDCHPERLLLTGQVDDTEAVWAFNAGYIDKFLSKSSPSLLRSLDAAISTLQQRPMPRTDDIWRATLSPQQTALLARKPVELELTAFIQESFIEYAIVGSPFGVLGVGYGGDVGWIQIVEGTRESAQDLSDSDIRDEFGLDASSAATRVRQLGDSGTWAAYFPVHWIPLSESHEWTYAGYVLREQARMNGGSRNANPAPDQP